MRILILTWIAAFIISGCAFAPPLPQIESKRGDRFGILVNIGDYPVHKHIGFPPFEKKYPYPWNLNAEISRRMAETVRNAGFIPIDLSSEGVAIGDVSGLIQPVDTAWRLEPGKATIWHRLHHELNLRAIITIKDSHTLIDSICQKYSCTYIFADAPGLYSFKFFWTIYKAMMPFDWNVYVLNPIANTAKADPLLFYLNANRTASINGFNGPADIDQLTEAEFAPVKEAILQSTASATMEAVKTLNTK